MKVRKCEQPYTITPQISLPRMIGRPFMVTRLQNIFTNLILDQSQVNRRQIGTNAMLFSSK
jgi:hypothetical protein